MVSRPFYERLSMEQVITTYRLINLLRRLRVIGTLELQTVGSTADPEMLGAYDIIDMTDNNYGIEKIGYDPTKGKTNAEELLEKIFGRKATSYRGTP